VGRTPSQSLHRIQPIQQEFLLESTPEEDRIVAEHFKHLKRLTEEGAVLLGERTTNADPSSPGIVVFEAESEDAAHEVVRNDPAIKASVFRTELFPYRVALAGPRTLPS